MFRSGYLPPVVWLICAGKKTNLVLFNKFTLSSEGKPLLGLMLKFIFFLMRSCVV